MDSPFMEHIAAGLVEHGFPVLRFDYPYMERRRLDGKRRPPDRAPILENTHHLALTELEARAEGARILMGGKSMGGRIASHLAARGEACAGLFFLGYPLHPAGKPERVRSEHFPALAQPGLFLQGTRDPLCNLDLLDRALASWGGRTSLDLVEGADHDFAVLRSENRERTEVLDSLVGSIDRWERACFPPV